MTDGVLLRVTSVGKTDRDVKCMILLVVSRIEKREIAEEGGGIYCRKFKVSYFRSAQYRNFNVFFITAFLKD